MPETWKASEYARVDSFSRFMKQNPVMSIINQTVYLRLEVLT